MKGNLIRDEYIFQIIRKVSSADRLKVRITGETDLRQQLDMDSIGFLSIVFSLEEEFGIDLSGFADRLAEAIHVSDLVAVVRLAACDAAPP